MRPRGWPTLVLALFTVTITASPVAAQAGQAGGAAGASGPRASHPVVRYATHSDATPQPLRALPPLPDRVGEIFEVPEEADLPGRDAGGTATPDAAVQAGPAPSASVSGAGGHDGIGNIDGVLPPDPNGDIGPTQYVETVNLHYAVYNRAGTLTFGPVSINTLWQGFGGACETSNDGDPIVQYDQLADRWMISQFALPRYPRGPFYQCVAVSQTGDATGSFYRYEFLVSNTKLNDYPKFGVWPDAYYMSINQFSCKFIGCNWAGAGAVAFERAAMLAGLPARMVYFDLYNTDPNLGGMLPSDLDGSTLPPGGAENLFAQMDDNAWGYSPDQLQLWGFHVDWANPSASTFTRRATIGVSAFDSDMCGYARNCIPQPGGTKLDALSDRLMYRLAYRNFGDHQSLVVNHTVDVTGSDRAGVRWYELRNGGSGWMVAQQSTYSPDGANRWVASAAMNGAGDLAIAYSVSSSTISPSIRAAGRAAGDQLNTLGSEVTLKAGAGYQSHTSGRWGDYSMLAVDPLDDCTFWYAGEYTYHASTADWRTFIGSFTVSGCGATPNPPVADFTATPLSGAAPLSVQFTDTSTGSPSSWVWTFGDGGTSTVANPSHTYTDPGDYTVTLTATNGDGSNTATKAAYIHVTQAGGISLQVTGYKRKGLQQADLSWSGAQGTTVDIYRNGTKITTTANDGAYTDAINNRGSGSYGYRVCEADTTTCSATVTIGF